MLLMMAACERDYKVATDASAISFATDTLSFDTVFANRTTPVASVCIYNNSDDDIVISRIALDGGENSQYVVNINGIANYYAQDIHLRSSDSLYIFVSLRPVKSSDTEAIRIISDGITVNSGNCTSHLDIVAYALSANELRGVLRQDTTLIAGTTYIISDSLIVAEGANLKIEEGVNIYMESGASIGVYGTMHVAGTAVDPVVIRSSRLDEFYDNIPSQWGNIFFHKNSRGNVVDNVRVSGATNAFIVDSAATIDITSTQVSHVGKNGVWAASAEVNIGNSLIFACGGAAVEVSGGALTIEQSTLAGYYAWDLRKKASLNITADEGDIPLDKALIINSIICGTRANEIEIDSTSIQAFHAENSIFRLDSKWHEDDEYFSNVTITKDLYFVDIEEYDYHLTEKSPAIDGAKTDVSSKYPLDLDGFDRPAETPDIGAFEYFD